MGFFRLSCGISTCGVLCVALVCQFLHGQSITTGTSPGGPKFYRSSDGVTNPELLPGDHSGLISHDCTGSTSAKVKISMVVDAAGKPRRMFFLDAAGNELDLLALDIVGSDSFKPGMLNGNPVDVGQSIEMRLVGCIEHPGFQDGKPTGRLRLGREPEQKLKPYQETKAPRNLRPNKGVTPPYPIFDGANDFEREALKDGLKGKIAVGIIVDANGIPENPKIVESADHRFDEKAIHAAGLSRYIPAMKDGEPVAVMIVVVLSVPN